MKKSTIIYCSIIAVLFVSVLYLLYLNFNKAPTTNTFTPKSAVIPTPDPTVSWKTYTREYKEIPISPTLFSFELKYPSNWFTEGLPGSGDVYFSIPNYRYPGVLVLGIEPNNGKTIEEYIKRDSIPYEFVKKINRSDLNGVIVSDPATEGNSVYIAFITKGNYIISLLLTSNPPDLGKDPLIILDQILSTFKFTDSDISTWQTYENKEWAISFLYPENYFFENRLNNPNAPIYFWKNGSDSKPYYNYDPVRDSINSNFPDEYPLLILQNYKIEIKKFLTSEDGGPIDMTFIKDIKNINPLLKVYLFGQDVISQECAVETPQKTTITISCSDNQLKDPVFLQILSTFKFTQ